MFNSKDVKRSSQYFTNVFTRQMGCSPGDYRKRNR